MPSTGNTSKLIAANTLVRAIQCFLQGLKVYVLMDSWYMRRRVISANTRLGFSVIGQVRIDARLYDLPLSIPLRKFVRVRQPDDFFQNAQPDV